MIALILATVLHCRPAPDAYTAKAPAPMSGIGTSVFPVTTKSKDAQRWITQGVNLLHGFWDLEAYRAFREAARLDPECAMAQWGIVVSLGFNAQEMAEERGAALKRAIELAPRATDREQHYIRAVSLMIEKGRAAYVAEMEALIDLYPDDVEAQLFLANTLSTPASSYAGDGRPREGKLYGQAILRNLLRTHPEHAAVHHYWIHAVENGPRPQEALASAEKLPRLAPNAPHMLHMPGHIYYRLGRYDEARAAFLVSMERDRAYMKEHGVAPVDAWNYVHNLDYLVGTCAEDGRYEDGVRWATELAKIAVDDRLKARGAGYVTFGGRTALARLQMRYERWEEAVASLSAVQAPAGSLSADYIAGVLAFARGMAALQKGDVDGARAQSVRLPDRKIELGSDWYWTHAARILAVHELELRGAISSARGEHDAAIALLLQAVEKERDLGYWEPPHYARPVVETLARAYERAGRREDAIEAWTRALRLRPNNVHATRALVSPRR